MRLLRWLNKRSFFSSLISLSFSSLSVIAETISVDDTNGTIQYSPLAAEGAQSLWSSHVTQVGYNYSSTSTSSSQATAEFSFQGIAVYLGSVISEMSSDINITLDGQHHIVSITRPGSPKSTTVFSMTDLQPSVQHRMVIQKASTASTSSTPGDTDGSVLDIDFISYTVLDNDAVPDNDAGHNTTAQPANTPTGTVPLTAATAKSHLSAGILLAIVIAILLGVAIGVTTMVFTRRRRTHILSKPQVSPLVLRDPVRLPPPPPPAAPRRPQFRTENLPHFVAPPSVWNLPSGSDISSAPHQAPPIRPPHIEREKHQTTLVVANPSSSHGHQSSLSTIDHNPASPQAQDDAAVVSSSEVHRDDRNPSLDIHASRRTHSTYPLNMPTPLPTRGPRSKKKRIFFTVNPASEVSSSS
ncbi:hypothetical protein BD410DRAFT_794756 [Rickenella mellea]|uniref:Mid2 domain-containing protein n=1 Tax=Rickenella mellea TaxID=50990 RepID=A0A4Y7PNI7_9AGAM|nr:hypothetical protein BD410DRAFT_794756 [Rickenella mellea]